MKTSMDSAGRVVIPSAIRRQAGLRTRAPLDVRCRDGVIEIEAQSLPVKLVREGRLTVAVPESDIEARSHVCLPLPQRRTVDAVRYQTKFSFDTAHQC